MFCSIPCPAWPTLKVQKTETTDNFQYYLIYTIITLYRFSSVVNISVRFLCAGSRTQMRSAVEGIVGWLLWSSARAVQGRQGELSGYTPSTCLDREQLPPSPSPSLKHPQASSNPQTVHHLQLYTCVSCCANAFSHARQHEHGMVSIIQRTLPFDQGFSSTPAPSLRFNANDFWIWGPIEWHIVNGGSAGACIYGVLCLRCSPVSGLDYFGSSKLCLTL